VRVHTKRAESGKTGSQETNKTRLDMNYYNEHDIKTAAWLRELIKQGLIPDGDVDTRSITEVKPDDLRQYTQCHFFAGIGGWSLALELAGWPADRPVWTGSCPCQPFSSAGKGLGDKDERHLWPVFFDLIRQCRPDAIFGEQVASAIGKGWLDGVSADLESEGYACGAAVLGAHSVGSPHIRQRLYWVADVQHSGLQGHWGFGEESIQARREGTERHCAKSCAVGGVGLPDSDRCQPGSNASTSSGYGSAAESTSSWDDYRLANCRDGKTRRIPTEPTFQPLAHGISARVVRLRGYGNAIVPQVAAEFVKAFTETKEAENDFC
jgi:DNA (cytosine-5)-methyltransferase 1